MFSIIFPQQYYMIFMEKGSLIVSAAMSEGEDWPPEVL